MGAGTGMTRWQEARKARMRQELAEDPVQYSHTDYIRYEQLHGGA